MVVILFIYHVALQQVHIIISALMQLYRIHRDRMVVGFPLQLPMKSASITTDVVSSNLNQDEVYNIM
jgi:hypothetical protein